MKSICKKITQNRKDISDLETNNRVLTNNLIKEYGNVMDQDEFWALCDSLRKEIEDRRDAVKNECYEQGVHNFFCNQVHSSKITYQDAIDFVFTYRKVVNKVSSDDSIWEHASQFEYMSDDGWHDFTDFLPLEGRGAYEHVLNKGGEVMENGCKPWTRDHEGYILSNLTKKIGDYANHALTEDEEDEIWV